MITLYNHENSPVWSEKNQKMGLGSANGARSYSKVITQYYYPIFEKVFQDSKEKVAVITVTTESKPVVFKDYDRLFIFMHECRYKQQPTVARAKAIAEANRHAEVWFIVWEEDTAKVLKERGLKAIYLPMAIDVKEVLSHKTTHPKGRNKIIWFGNIRGAKVPFYKHFVNEARKMGYTVDTVSGNHFNNGDHTLTRNEVLDVLQYYDYGVGVGICAHEMSALGLKVFIYSYGFYANCAYTKADGKRLISKNLCSPEEAHVLVKDAILNKNNMVVIDPVDVRDNAKLLASILKENFQH